MSQSQSLTPYQQLVKTVLLTPGTVISFSILYQKGVFRKAVSGESGKVLSSRIANIMNALAFGNIERFTTGNKSQVSI